MPRLLLLLATLAFTTGLPGPAAAGPGYEAAIDRRLPLDARWQQQEVLRAQRLEVEREESHGPGPALRIRRPQGKHPRWWELATLPLTGEDVTRYNRLVFWAKRKGGGSACLAPVLRSADPLVSPLPGIMKTVYTRAAIPGEQWTQIVFDFPHARPEWLRGVTGVTIHNIYAYPQPSEDQQEFTLLIAGAELQHVTNPRKWLGWEPDPQVITVNQLGYKPLSRKVALANPQSALGPFVVRDAATGQEVFRGDFAPVRTRLGVFLQGDFSALDRPGRYTLQAGDVTSVPFPVAERPYQELARETLRVLAGMRCGQATELHERCHLDAAWDESGKRFVDIAGGYHDAGDLRRYDRQPVFQPLYHMEARNLLPEGDPLAFPLLDESRWCLQLFEKEWALFGHPVMGCLTRGDREGNYYTDNRPGTADDYLLNGVPLHDEFGQFMPAWLAGLAEAARETDPALSRRALALAEKAWTRYGSGGALGTLGATALYRATGEPRYRAVALAGGDALLARQENRVVAGTSPPFSGFFAANAARTEMPPPLQWRAYNAELTALAELLRTFPDAERRYDWHFALRRYADFYLKALQPHTGPYHYPVEPVIGGGESLLGVVDGTVYGYPFGGQDAVSGNIANCRRMLTTLPWMRVAAALGDPEVENVALRHFSQFVGENPFNVSYVVGFGEDALRNVYSLYAPARGTVTLYPDPYVFARNAEVTHINEVYTVAQTGLNAGAVALDAPCRVTGRITAAGRPFAGSASLRLPGGRVAQEFRTRPDGTYGPLWVSGGGHYRLTAGGVERPFPAVAGGQATINLDTRHEVILTGLRAETATGAAGTGVDLARDARPTLSAGVPWRVTLALTSLGSEGGPHTVRLRAANAAVEPAEQAVTVTAGAPATVTFTLTPRTAGETLCVLAELDGDAERRWELSGVAGRSAGEGKK